MKKLISIIVKGDVAGQAAESLTERSESLRRDLGVNRANMSTASIEDQVVVFQALQNWGEGIKTDSVDRMVGLYADTAAFTGTLANKPYVQSAVHSAKAVTLYMDRFLPQVNKVVFPVVNIVSVTSDTVTANGRYEFSRTDGSQIQAQFTFQVRKADGKIVLHNSKLAVDPSVEIEVDKRLDGAGAAADRTDKDSKMGRKEMARPMEILDFNSFTDNEVHKQLVREALENWKKQIAAGDPEQMLTLYADKASFTGTLANGPHLQINGDPENQSVRLYMKRFMPLVKSVNFPEVNIMSLSKEAATASGRYVFEKSDGSGMIEAQFTFQINMDGKIVLHDSKQPVEKGLEIEVSTAVIA